MGDLGQVTQPSPSGYVDNFTVWGDGAECCERQNGVTSFAHFTRGEWCAGGRERSRNIGSRPLRNLGSWDGGGDGVVGSDMYLGQTQQALRWIRRGIKEERGDSGGSHFFSPSSGMSNRDRRDQRRGGHETRDNFFPSETWL